MPPLSLVDLQLFVLLLLSIPDLGSLAMRALHTASLGRYRLPPVFVLRRWLAGPFRSRNVGAGIRRPITKRMRSSYFADLCSAKLITPFCKLTQSRRWVCKWTLS
jgi:hypothetical protein